MEKNPNLTYDQAVAELKKMADKINQKNILSNSIVQRDPEMRSADENKVMSDIYNADPNKTDPVNNLGNYKYTEVVRKDNIGQNTKAPTKPTETKKVERVITPAQLQILVKNMKLDTVEKAQKYLKDNNITVKK